MPSIETTRTLLTWTAPALAIPTLRYTQDDRGQRNALFIRDLSTYTIGASIFLVSDMAFRKLFHGLKLAPKTAELGAFILALTLNILYAGMGAVQLSHWFNRHYGDPSQASDKPDKFDKPDKKAEPKPTPPPGSSASSNASPQASPYVPPYNPYGNNFLSVGPNALSAPGLNSPGSNVFAANGLGFNAPSQFGPNGYNAAGTAALPVGLPFAPMPPMPRSYIA